MATEDESSERRRYGLDRLLALSDGVFAFAATLLVLDLAVPVLSLGASSADLFEALSKEYINILSYLLSFYIAGIWWTAHHRNFSWIRNSDTALRWLNLLFLLCIALLPFFTKILDQYINLQAAVVLYATDQAGAGVFMTLSWWYASGNHHLIDKNMKNSTIRFYLLRNAIAPLFFIFSIAISFVNPGIALYSWWGMVPALFIISRLQRKREGE